MLLPGMEGKEEVHTLVLCSAAWRGARGTWEGHLGLCLSRWGQNTLCTLLGLGELLTAWVCADAQGWAWIWTAG